MSTLLVILLKIYHMAINKDYEAPIFSDVFIFLLCDISTAIMVMNITGYPFN
jgi:hypothetical protein